MKPRYIAFRSDQVRGVTIHWTRCDACAAQLIIRQGRLEDHYDGFLLDASPAIQRHCTNSGALITDQLPSAMGVEA